MHTYYTCAYVQVVLPFKPTIFGMYVDMFVHSMTYLCLACFVPSDLRIVDSSRLLVHSEAFELVVYQRAVMEQIEHARNVLVSKYVHT